MPIEENIFAGEELSEAEKRQLSEVIRAGKQTLTGRLIDSLLTAALPAIGAGVLTFMQATTAKTGLMLCKKQGYYYIPEEGLLEKTLRFPISILISVAIVMAIFTYGLRLQQRLAYQLLIRKSRKLGDVRLP